MPEPRTTAVAIVVEPARTWTVSFLHATATSLTRAGAWAGDTAQKFGSLVSDLMGPAVVSAYAFAFWSLAANLGWTNTFIFANGPLSNWLVWMTIAILLNIAAGILKRRTRADE